jgi:hypothetical protein
MKKAAFAAATGLIVLVCLFHLLHSIYYHDKYLHDAYRIVLFYGVPLGGLVLSFLLIVTYSDRNVALSVNIAAVIASVLLFETVKVFSAGAVAHSYDVAREDYDAAASTHDRVSVAIPTMSYADLLGAADGSRPVPLSGLAHAYTLLCEEARPTVAYASDRYGFNNPDVLWDESSPGTLLIGDSFIQGRCNPEGQTIADVVRMSLPKTIALGASGNGPLLELATLIEYGKLARPKDVIWCFFEGNDFDDLEVEKRFDVLDRYFENGWSLELASRQDAVDEIVRAKLERDVIGQLKRRLPSHGAAQHAPLLPDGLASAKVLRRILGMQALGAELGLSWGRGGGDQELLGRVLKRAKTEAATYGASFYLCYLPSSSRFSGRFKIDAPYDSYRLTTLATAEKLGIPVIDVTQAFIRSGEGLKLFLRTRMHYSDQGARVAGEAIARYLRDATAAR